jgi:hypothetical protein
MGSAITLQKLRKANETYIKDYLIYFLFILLQLSVIISASRAKESETYRKDITYLQLIARIYVSYRILVLETILFDVFTFMKGKYRDSKLISKKPNKQLQLLKIIAFWDTRPCNLVEVDRRFRGAFCLHHQIREGSMPF